MNIKIQTTLLNFNKGIMIISTLKINQSRYAQNLRLNEHDISMALLRRNCCHHGIKADKIYITPIMF